MPHIGQLVIFTPLSVSISTSFRAFAVLFCVACRAGFGAQPTLSLLNVTSSYGKATVCTFLYLSYELRRNSKNCLRFIDIFNSKNRHKLQNSLRN